MNKIKVTQKIDRSGPEYQKPNKKVSLGVNKSLTTTNFILDSDGTPAGDQAVTDMEAVCEQDYTTLKGIFGVTEVPSTPFVVTVDVNAGGAFHQTCADTGIHVIPEDAASLLVAEVVECFEAQNGGWDCGDTNGEGLSRALAITVRPFKVLTGLDGDVQGWWNNGNPHDFVNNNAGSDQDQQSNACGTLFLFYLNSLGYSWNKIVANGGKTLGETYNKITGRTGQEGFTAFVAALNGIQQPWADNPFTGAPAPTPTPTPTPTPNPTPTPQGPGCLFAPFAFINGLWRTIFG